ncbi:MAG: hemin ABC transporter substrate-binding protein [Bacteroidota bacterium]
MRASILSILVLGFAACATDSAEPTAAAADSTTAAETALVTDVQPAENADRIVTLGGPITETVYALGMGESVVGADQSSLFPADVMEKPRLNYFRQTSAEGVLSLEPTLVIASEGAGPPGVLDQIRDAGVEVLTTPEVQSVEGAEERVRMVATMIGRDAEADRVIDAMRAELAEVEAVQPETPPRALFVYARGAGTVMVSGTGTSAEAVMRLAGAENAVSDFEEFQPLTAEAMVAAAPDVIVIPERGLESIGGVDGLLRQPGVAETPAGQNRRVVAVDDALLLGFGPRIGEGVRALAEGLSG